MSTSRIVGPTLREKIRKGSGIALPDGSKPPDGAVVHLPSKPAHIINDLGVSLGDAQLSADGLISTGEGAWVTELDRWYNISFMYKPFAQGFYKILGETALRYTNWVDAQWMVNIGSGNVMRITDGSAVGYLTGPYLQQTLGVWYFVSINLRYLTGGGLEAEGYQWNWPRLVAFSGDLPTAAPTFNHDFSLLETTQPMSAEFDSVGRFNRRLSFEEMNYLDNERTGRVYADLIDDGFDLTDLHAWYDLGEATGTGPRRDAHNTYDLDVIQTGTYTDALAVQGISAGQARDGDPVTVWLGELGTEYDCVPIAGTEPVAVHGWDGSGWLTLGMTTTPKLFNKSGGAAVAAIEVFGASPSGMTHAHSTKLYLSHSLYNPSWLAGFNHRAFTSGPYMQVPDTDVGALTQSHLTPIPPDEKVWSWCSLATADGIFVFRTSEDVGPVSYPQGFSVLTVPAGGSGQFSSYDSCYMYEVLIYDRGLKVQEQDQLTAYLDRYANGFDPSLVPGMSIWLKDGLKSEYPDGPEWFGYNNTLKADIDGSCGYWHDQSSRGLDADRGADQFAELRDTRTGPNGQYMGLQFRGDLLRRLTVTRPSEGFQFEGKRRVLHAVVATLTEEVPTGYVYFWSRTFNESVYMRNSGTSYRAQFRYINTSGTEVSAEPVLTYSPGGETQFTRVIIAYLSPEKTFVIVNGSKGVELATTDMVKSASRALDMYLGSYYNGTIQPNHQVHEVVSYGSNSANLEPYAYDLSEYLINKYLGTPYP